MSALLDRMMKVGSVKSADVMSDSAFFNVRDVVQTDLCALNIALGGNLDGGITPGLTVIAGPSRSFKTCMSLYMVAAYLRKYKDGVCLYYDSEFGSNPDYLRAFGVDPARCIHIPVEHVEQLKFDIVKRLEEIKKGDKVIVFIDSIGNLASKRESDNAMNDNSAADMSRAQAIKSLFRIITPHLTIKDIPAIVVAHVYTSMEMFAKTIVSGGCVDGSTQIFMADGTVKQIKDVTVGDEVLNINDEAGEVTNAWDPTTLDDGNPECFEITFEDGSTVICSEEHAFVRNGEWVSAIDLKQNDDVETISSINNSSTKLEDITDARRVLTRV